MGEIRLQSGKLQNSLLTRSLLIDMIYTSLLEVARDLKDADTPEFREKASIISISGDGVIDLSDIDGGGTKLNVESIIKIFGQATKTAGGTVDMSAIPTDAIEFDYLVDYPQKQNNVFWYREGESVYLYLGSNLSGHGSVFLHYDRIPEKAILDATYIDLSDRFIPLLINKVLEKVSV